MAKLQDVKLSHEGDDLIGQIAIPGGAGPYPAVMVMASAMGLGAQVRERALHLAKLGYVALATDMYGGGAYFTDGGDAGAPLMRMMENPDLARSRILAWCDLLKARTEVDAQRIAAIGFCFGGHCVLELARSGADLKAVVSYHGLLKTTQLAGKDGVKCQVTVYAGGLDPYAPREDIDQLRQELDAAQARYQITVFSEAFHAFTDRNASKHGSPGIAYNAQADAVSWAGTLALLEDVFR